MAIEITGQKTDVSVGEKISVGVKYTKEWGVLKSIEWSIPGTIVKNYVDTQNSAQVTQVGPADKKKFTLDFYWVDGADGRVVEAKCVFTSSSKDVNKTVSATFNVKAVTLDKFDAKTDSVKLAPAAAPTRVGFGERGVTPGIQWDWKVTVPKTGDGYVKDLQTIRINNRQTTTGGVKQVRALPGTKVPPPGYNIDTDNPYSLPGDYPPCVGFPHKVASGASFSDNSTFDTPSNPLAGMTRVVIDREFKYFIMYKPDKPDSIWVPVAKAEWNCRGAAELHVGWWQLVSPSGGVTSKGTVTTEFPSGSGNSKNVQFVNE